MRETLRQNELQFEEMKQTNKQKHLYGVGDGKLESGAR